MDDDEAIGRWYDKQRVKAENLASKLKSAKARNAPESEIERIERDLERARYVGD